MSDVKSIIAKNITDLRLSKGMKQLELAEKLNYSDKAVSKWERAESLPDIATLLEIADIFGVTLDYLVKENQIVAETENKENEKPKYIKVLIMGISVLAVWFIALLAFVLISILAKKVKVRWMAFLCALPISLLLCLIFNTVWFDRRKNYLIISLLMWSILAAVQLSLAIFSINVSIIYLLGLQGQLIILLCSLIGKKSLKGNFN